MFMEYTYKVLKYIALLIVVYFAMRLVNKDKMKQLDTLIVSLIIVISLAIIENIRNMFKSNPNPKPMQCGKGFENMTDTSTPAPVATPITTTQPVATNSAENVSSTSSSSSSDDSSSGSSTASSNTSGTSGSSASSTSSNSNAIVNALASATSSSPMSITIQNSNGTVTYVRSDDGNYSKSSTASSESASSTDSSGTASSSSLSFSSVVPVNTSTDNVVIDYSPIQDYNRLPISNLEYDHGYTFMPPKDWYPTPPKPPICITDKKCPVCPMYTNGTNIDLKTWNESNKVS